MTDRIVHVVWAKPRASHWVWRGLGCLHRAVVLLASWLSATAPAARTVCGS